MSEDQLPTQPQKSGALSEPQMSPRCEWDPQPALKMGTFCKRANVAPGPSTDVLMLGTASDVFYVSKVRKPPTWKAGVMLLYDFSLKSTLHPLTPVTCFLRALSSTETQVTL